MNVRERAGPFFDFPAFLIRLRPRPRRQQRAADPAAVARRHIDEAIEKRFDEPLLIRHWRARQIARAMVSFAKREFAEVVPTDQVPLHELERELEGQLEELRCRRKLLRWAYGT